jgi:amidohydrolase
MTDDVISGDILAYKEEARRIRRALHTIPEPGFKEFETQAWIVDYLKNLGFAPQPLVGTGVSLLVPGNGKTGETIAFRSDMDGLDGCETNAVDYRSKHEGMMHACGHDGHMTMLLLFARWLAEHPGACPRDVLLIFQPAEEGPGGAKPVVDSGILEQCGVDAVFGFHLFPFLPEKVVAVSPGPIIAMNSEFYVDIRGKSGHAAKPENTVDAIAAAAGFVTAVHSIISRTQNPLTEALISIGTIQGGTRMNSIADLVQLSGTMRSFSEQVHFDLQKQMRARAEGIDRMTGTRTEIRFVDMYPPVVNDPALYNAVWPLLGREGEKIPFEKQMIAEDFAFYGKALPALFMGLGCGSPEKGFTSSLHATDFNFDEDVLLRGVDIDRRIATASVTFKG